MHKYNTNFLSYKLYQVIDMRGKGIASFSFFSLLLISSFNHLPSEC